MIFKELGIVSEAPSREKLELIRKKFGESESIVFIARPFNCFQYRKVNLGGESGGIVVYFKELLVALGIDPDMLGEVYTSTNEYYLDKYRSADKREFDDLPPIPLNTDAFAVLSKMIDKAIVVMREDPTPYGSPYLSFTVYPSGRVIRSDED